MRIKTEWAQKTMRGEREHNEDSVKVTTTETGACFALADGLGGHGYGEEASQIAVELSCIGMQNMPFSHDSMDRCFTGAQEMILSRQQEINDKTALKTTLVLLCIENDQAFYGHIGDSRLYCFTNAKRYWRTTDHSVPQVMVLAKKLKEKHIRFHEDRNRLLRVLGMECEDLRHEVNGPVLVRAGQAFLLCSDGWWEWITEDEMMKTLKKSQNPQIWLDEMERTILEKGRGKGMDNYSAIAAFISVG